jgi:nitrate/nitrite transport system substrate-binding protein
MGLAGSPVKPMVIPWLLNRNGQAITLNNKLKQAGVKGPKDVKPLADRARASGDPLTFAMTFPPGTHAMWMRYWLASGGIHPDKDVTLITIPPPQMVANMKVNTMEAFCVGEPWNAQLVNQKIGFTALVTGELWYNHPEKSLAMRADWVDKNPKAAKAALMAVQEAAQWCDANLAEMCKIVSGREWFKVPVEDIIDRSTGTIDYGTGKVVKNSPLAMKFWKEHASYPFQSHDLWFLTEDMRWGYLPADTDRKALINQVNREDLWRAAAKTLGVPAGQIPASASRGPEKFFDGKVFDPNDPVAYLKSLAIKRAMV